MNIGIIGLDSSHCETFTQLLNDRTNPHHISGATITHAIPVYSKDVEISRNRFPYYRQTLENTYNVVMVKDVHTFMEAVDAVIIATVDGRNHLHWIQQLVAYEKPIFIDKPFVMSSEEMQRVQEWAGRFQTPLMSSSSLRYAESIQQIRKKELANLKSGYFYGPLPQQHVMPGYFWYGIHLVEMIVSLVGTNISIQRREKVTPAFEYVSMMTNSGIDLTIRGDYAWHDRFGGVVHFEDETVDFQLWTEQTPYYAKLLENVLQFFQSGQSPVSLAESAAVIRLIEKINAWNPLKPR